MTAVMRALSAALTGEPGWHVAAGGPAELFRAADAHGVTALLWEALDGVEGMSGLRAELGPTVRAAAALDVVVQRQLQGTLGALDSAGIRALVVKGTALAYTAYPHPWLRPRTDTDVLVDRADVAAATRVLEARGFRRSAAVTSGELVSHQIAFERRDDSGVPQVVDLHWKIVNPQMLADALPFEPLWRRAERAPALAPSARIPSRVDSVAIAAVHRLAHHQGHDRLIWLYDIDLLTRRLAPGEWSALARLAIDREIAGLCVDALRQARDLLHAVLPAAIEADLAAAAPGEPSRLYLQQAVRKRDVLMNDLVMLADWRSRLRLLREHAFPPAAFIRQRYGAANRWPLPALYLHRLVTGAARWVRP
jgi:hypothetical protein